MSKSRFALAAVMVAVLCVGSGQCTPESRVPDAGKAGVAVANNSSSAIVAFHVVAGAKEATDWGPNLLTAAILPGSQQTVVDVAAGDYDVLLVASDPGPKADTNFDIYGVSLTGGINYEFGHTDQGPTLSSNQPPPASADHFVGYWRCDYIPIGALPLGYTCTNIVGAYCRIPHYFYLGPINSQGMGPREICDGACGNGTCEPDGLWMYDGGRRITTSSGSPLFYYIDDNTISRSPIDASSWWTYKRVTCK